MPKKEWLENPRWNGVERPYDAAEVMRLRGSITIEHTLARMGADKLWKLMHEQDYVNALGALTGNQAMQQVRAGLQAILPGPAGRWQPMPTWPVRCIPISPLYPADSVPSVVRRINNTPDYGPTRSRVRKARAISTGLPPIVADAEAGFGGVLNAHELMKDMICSRRGRGPFRGPAGLGQEVWPHGRQGARAQPQEAVQKLIAARLAADICNVPTIIVARTDAMGASSDHHRHRRARSGVRDRRANQRRFLPDHRRTGFGDRPRAGLRAVLPIWSGVRPRPRAWSRPRPSARPSAPNFRTRCWP